MSTAVASVSVAGYPEGHPWLEGDHAFDAVAAWRGWAGRSGVRVDIVTQFCFEGAPILAWLESVAPAEGWLLGETFSLADYAVASALRSLQPVGWGRNAEAYPATAAWYDRVVARPAWQAVAAIEDKPRR